MPDEPIPHIQDEVIAPTADEFFALVRVVPAELRVTWQDRQLLGEPSAFPDWHWCDWDLKEKLTADLSPEARSRAEHLLAIQQGYWERLCRFGRESGRDAAIEKVDHLCEEIEVIDDGILSMSPTTLAVVAAQLQVLKRWRRKVWETHPDDLDYGDKLLRRVVDRIFEDNSDA